jgi:sulfur-oxidizing protein SoxZ
MKQDNGRIRARLKDGLITVKVIMRHPMETGSRKDPSTGEPIARHFIREVVCEHNDKPVLSLDWGWGVSSDPYLAFEIKDGREGDTVTVRWVDNKQQSGVLVAEVK